MRHHFWNNSARLLLPTLREEAALLAPPAQPARPGTCIASSKPFNACTGAELSRKTLGLVGLGRVGSQAARRALGLDMRVLVFDPYVPDDHVRHLGLEPIELEALLETAEMLTPDEQLA
jgi:D-3-phosphoglycerate dehydrogenase